MKRLFNTILSGVIVAAFISCEYSPKVPPVDIGLMISDSNWTDTMAIQSARVIRDIQCIAFTGKPNSSSWINRNLGTSFEWEEDITSEKYSPAERLAMGKIRERTRVLQEYYEQHFKDGSHQWFTNIYIREKPRILADKLLFGMAPGEDLSAFFKYVGSSMKCTGPEYTPSISKPCAFADYFTEGTMIPSQIPIHSTTMPEELSEDDDITLTIVFPVTIEHYWSWLLELYENPDAEESFTDTEMFLKVSLKDLKVKGEIVQAS